MAHRIRVPLAALLSLSSCTQITVASNPDGTATGSMDDGGETAAGAEQGGDTSPGGSGASDDSGNGTGGGPGGGDSGGTDTDGGIGGAIGEGLPCEIQDMISTTCVACHSNAPVGNQLALLTRDDFLAPAISNPNRTVGEVVFDRITATTAPMPPAPASPVPVATTGIFGEWLAQGMPPGDCMPIDMEDPFDVDPVCSSDTWWTFGDEEDPRMHPGIACIDCHNREGEGPRFAIAGTAFSTGHEPNDCFGAPQVVVKVTDTQGRTVQIGPSNSAGNFFLETQDAPPNFVPPFAVKIMYDGRERAMVSQATSGDCNICHTQDGDSDAPGRILLP